MERAPRFPKQLIERLPALCLRHAFKLNGQTLQQAFPIPCPSGRDSRDDHLDMRRQLRREPGRIPRRIARGQLIESVDEENCGCSGVATISRSLSAFSSCA